MNVVPLAMALPYQVGIQSPAEEHFLAAFLREEIVEKMQGNGLIEFGAHGRTRTAGLLITKEVLEDHFPTGALLRSNTEAIANNRCLAALPKKSYSPGWR